MIISQISVVVPVKNEQDNVANLMAEIHAALQNFIHEIIYVDDGSTDETYARLKQLKIQYPQLKVVRHAESYGQTKAIRSGVKSAQYPWIATLDGDGQNDPADIPKLIAAITDGVDLVGGNRRASRKDTWIKRTSSVVANTVRSKMLNDDTPDTGCGLKVFRREAFLDLPYFDHMHRFLPALIKRRGGKVLSIPVAHRNRKHGKSNYGTIDRLMVGIVDLFGVTWLLRRAKIPLIVKEKD